LVSKVCSLLNFETEQPNELVLQLVTANTDKPNLSTKGLWVDPEKSEVKWDTEKHFSWGLDDITEESEYEDSGNDDFGYGGLGMRRMNNGAEENYLQFDRI
jgi:hypothetical protein